MGNKRCVTIMGVKTEKLLILSKENRETPTESKNVAQIKPLLV